MKFKKHRSFQQMITCHFLPTTFWLHSCAVFNSDALSLLELSLILHFELAPPNFCNLSHVLLAFSLASLASLLAPIAHMNTWSRWLAHSGCIQKPRHLPPSKPDNGARYSPWCRKYHLGKKIARHVHACKSSKKQANLKNYMSFIN